TVLLATAVRREALGLDADLAARPGTRGGGGSRRRRGRSCWKRDPLGHTTWPARRSTGRNRTRPLRRLGRRGNGLRLRLGLFLGFGGLFGLLDLGLFRGRLLDGFRLGRFDLGLRNRFLDLGLR